MNARVDPMEGRLAPPFVDQGVEPRVQKREEKVGKENKKEKNKGEEVS